ncbi:hypothetical protein ACIRFF_15225 [Streptomyces cyaneofuscatus]
MESIPLNVDAAGSFSGRSRTEELRVARSGEKPVLCFSTHVDTWYGCEIHKSEQAASYKLS